MGRLVLCVVVVLATFVGLLHSLSGRCKWVRIRACGFIVSLTVTQLLVRMLETPPYNFNFPGHLTLLHLLSTWVAALAYWRFAGDTSKGHLKSLICQKRILMRLVPIALSSVFSVIAANVALGYMAAGLTTLVSCLTPMVTALLSALMGRALPLGAWLGLGVALAGAIAASMSEMKAGMVRDHRAVLGLAVALAGVLLRSLKSVLQDTLLNASLYRGGESQALVEEYTISAMHLWTLQAPFMVLASLAFALCTEDPAQAFHRVEPRAVPPLLATCVSATALNVLGVITLKDCGASLMQAIGKLNVILTVVFSVQLLGEVLPGRVLVGGVVMLIGIGIFERAESQELEACKKAQKGALARP